MPASDTVYCDVSLPLFLPSACNQVPVSPWGVLMSRLPPCICVPALTSPSSPLNPDIFWSLVSFQVEFCARARGQVTFTTWQPCALVLATPHFLAMPELFSFPALLSPLPPPLVVMIPYILVEEVWGVALDISLTRSCCCHVWGC